MSTPCLRVEKSTEVVATSDGRVTLLVSIQIKRRSNHKLLTLPCGSATRPQAVIGQPTALQRALLRGYRWLELLHSGKVGNLSQISQREGVDSSYISRMLNLTTLAPDILQAILDDTLPLTVTLFDLSSNTPLLWDEQRNLLGKKQPSSYDLPN